MKFAKPYAFAALAVLLSVALGACGDDPPDNKDPQQQTDAGNTECDPATDPECIPEEEPCDLDSDCGDPRHYMCVDGACKAACTTKADCSSHPEYDGEAWPGCSGPLGCACDETRSCKPTACTADSECGTLVCKAGQCVEPDTSADACAIFPDYAVMRAGQPVTFRAVAYKNKKPVSLGANAFTWTALNSAVEQVDGGTFKGKDPTGGEATEAIKAEASGASCKAKVVVVGDMGTNKARVFVIDEMTGRPVADATVVIDGGASRITLEAEANVPGSYVTTTDLPAKPVVSVFHHDFQYVTLAGVSKTDLLVPIRRNATIKSGGFKGNFKNLPTAAISAGIAGASIAGSFTDLEVDLLIGELEETTLQLGSLELPNVPLPSGVVIGNKTEFRAFSAPGVCDNEDQVLSGSCGTVAAWGLMGTIPVAAVLPIVNDYMAGNGVNIGKALAAMMPHLSSFKSALARDVSFTLKSGAPDFSTFTTQDFEPTVELSLRQTVEVPLLPSGLDGAIVLSGAQVLGRGLVPLGLTAGTDTNDEFTTPDGKVIGIDVGANDEVSYHNDGKLTLRMAPSHSGIEGSEYVAITLALSTSGTLADGALATTGLVKFQESMPHTSTVSYGNAAFLGFGDGGDYNYRTGEFTGAKLVSGASINRIVFLGPNMNRWMVYFKEANFSVPLPPEGFEDRTIASGAPRATGSWRSPFIAQAIALKDGVDMDGLFEFDDVNANQIAENTTAFSIYELMTDVTFVEPADCYGGCSVATGEVTFKVLVTGHDSSKGSVQFQADAEKKTGAIGADRLASATFSLGAGTHTITARLVDTAGNPIDPPVQTTINVVAE
ncbi:MAG: hypothetical protein ACOX6T_06610 [Myxococcales bacterium]|jgi:hypothetical protein